MLGTLYFFVLLQCDELYLIYCIYVSGCIQTWLGVCAWTVGLQCVQQRVKKIRLVFLVLTCFIPGMDLSGGKHNIDEMGQC